jgi:DMSO/TMAO reductase YedYZ molybdopterin-dependent catalytic subunit
MSETVSRRGWIKAGLGAVAGASGLAIAARIADHYSLIPPDHRGPYGLGETLTYSTQRLLTSRQSLAREFNRSEISKITPVNGEPPKDDSYWRQMAEGFPDWRLTIDGLVGRPASFSLDELKRLPVSSQITHQACEEGWSFIAEWTGVSLSYFLNLVGILPQAKYLVFFAMDKKYDSLDMSEAWHPQTLLAYTMNGQHLPARHGAPIRVRVPRQLGFKSKKYLARIFVTDTVKNIGSGQGSSSLEKGFAWYGGI